MAKKTFLLDTSVYLTDANAIYSYGFNDVIIPLKVLEEIDKHKKRQDGVGSNARSIIRIFDGLRERGNLNKGVRIRKGKGIAYAKTFDVEDLPMSFDAADPDNQIIGTGLTEVKNNPSKKLIVVSRDINMRVKCDAVGLASADYILQQAVPARDKLYTGLSTHLVDEQIIDRFYEGKEPITIEKPDGVFYINQYIMLVSNSNEKKTAIARFDGYAKPLKKVINYRNGIWGVKPRNKEQTFALELLMDSSIPIVSLIGKAGSGKTLMAVAAGLEQVMEQTNKETDYKKLIVSRPIQPMGRDLGYLPGTLEEKMAPWLAPIQDNLQFLMGSDKATLDMYVENGTIELEALTYIRGRSIANAYIIIDEAQNLTVHEMKTILTRVGEGTKIILTGDIEQIDNVYVDETTNGLAYAIERLKAYSLTGHVTLKQGERSKVADLAAKIL
jgi:PhoH-like ATPase